ncbi:hypothetical protein N7G274_006426 [Stereocaulon virgatum]|uniref:YTH domain-containing protein n=1 Tax=Stereocaulon virgatum TaxID=373712 RepID=A0ABR4A7D1_9LECA
MASKLSPSTYWCPGQQIGHVQVSTHEHNTTDRQPRRLSQKPEESIEPLSTNPLIHGHDKSSGSSLFIQNSKHIEGDPLQDDNILTKGPRIADNTDGDPSAIIKVPSDQTLFKFRWGSSQRASGRSKSGLQILVPGRKIPVELVTGGPVTGKSIIYAYASSPSSSGRSTHSYGAIGDHLPSARSALPSSSAMPVIHESQSNRPQRTLQNARSSNRLSPLANLVMESVADQDPYQLLVLGETGPCRRQVLPQIIAPSRLKPLRRRSLSDLVEPRTTLSDQTGQSIPSFVVPRESTALEPHLPGGTGCSKDETTGDLVDTARAPCRDVPPVWYRAGPPFTLRGSKFKDGSTYLPFQHRNLDPATFSLPHGSKVFIMKSTNIYNLRASVTNGVWSSTNGANKVLQSAWEDRQEDEKIIFMFSITHSHKHSGKYVGMAEMSGPFNPDADPQIWAPGLKGNQGTIPMRWIVAKDVQFTAFNDLKYKGQCVTQLRHANTVPGEAGRLLVQSYFEAEHSDTAVIHPEYDTPITPPGPGKKVKRPVPHIRLPPGAQTQQPGAFAGQRPSYGTRPTYGPFHGPVEPSHLQQQPRYNSMYGVATRQYGQVFEPFPTHGYPQGAPFYRY